MGPKEPLTKTQHCAILGCWGQKDPTGVQKENKTDHTQDCCLKYFYSVTLHKGIKAKGLGCVFYGVCSQMLGSKLGQQLLPFRTVVLKSGRMREAGDVKTTKVRCSVPLFFT